MNRSQPAPVHHHEALRLTEKDDAILAALAQFHVLTAEQVTRLFYASGSLTYVQTKLKRLTEAGYCQRLFFQQKVPAHATYVYHLARAGRSHLAALGRDLDPRYRPTETAIVSDFFLRHTLACNDFYTGAVLLGRAQPAIRLHAWVHERDLRRQPVAVAVPEHGPRPTTRTVIPDGWLEFHLRSPKGTEQQCLLLELDGDTQEQQRWRRKVAELLVYAKGPYRQVFGTEVITVAVVAAPKEPGRAPARCAELRSWTERELAARGEQREADLFRFTAEPPATDPTRLFLAPVWCRPFDPTPRPLLELEGVSPFP